MFYSQEITISAQTTQKAPQANILVVTEGTVKNVWVRWRYGSGGLCGVRILYNEFQFWPLSQNEWIPSSPHPLMIPERKRLTKAPYAFKVESYNLDDVYEHKVWVAIEIEREERSGLVQRLLEFAQFGE